MLKEDLTFAFDAHTSGVALNLHIKRRLETYLRSHGVAEGDFRIAGVERVPKSRKGEWNAGHNGSIQVKETSRRGIHFVIPLPAIDSQTVVSCRLACTDGKDISDIVKAILSKENGSGQSSRVGVLTSRSGQPSVPGVRKAVAIQANPKPPAAVAAGESNSDETKKEVPMNVSEANKKILFDIHRLNSTARMPKSAMHIIMEAEGVQYPAAYRRVAGLKEMGLLKEGVKVETTRRYELTSRGRELILDMEEVPAETQEPASAEPALEVVQSFTDTLAETSLTTQEDGGDPVNGSTVPEAVVERCSLEVDATTADVFQIQEFQSLPTGVLPSEELTVTEDPPEAQVSTALEPRLTVNPPQEGSDDWNRLVAVRAEQDELTRLYPEQVAECERLMALYHEAVARKDTTIRRIADLQEKQGEIVDRLLGISVEG